MRETQRRGGAGLVLAGASLWGLIGLFNRGLLGAGLGPESIVLVRNVGGLIVLALVLALRDRSVFRVRLRDLGWFFGTGVVSVVCFTWCYFSCQERCSLAAAAILLYTSPAFVVLLSTLLWHEPVTRRKLLALALTLLGCAGVAGVWRGSLTITWDGLLLGLGAGFFYALYSIFGRYALRSYGPYTVTLYTFLFAGVGSLVFLRPRELAGAFSHPYLWGVAVGLVVIATVLPYLLYTAGLARVESGKAAILAAVEPVVAALVGVLVFHETMDLSTAAGIAAVLAAVVLLR